MGTFRNRAIAASILGIMALAVGSASAVECGEKPYDSALSFLQRQRTSEAIDCLSQLLRADPNNLKGRNLLGIALTTSGRFEEANRQYEKALELNPDFYPALKNLALNELTLHQTAKAKSHFETVLKHVPLDEVSHLSLGEIYFQEKKCRLALVHYQKASSLLVSNAPLILHSSECFLSENQAGQALALIQHLPENDSESHFRAGVILSKSGLFSDSAKQFEAARTSYADPYLAGYDEIVMLIKAKNYSQAIRLGQELLGTGYQRSELYSLLSEAYLKNDQLKEAYDALRKATEIDPKDENNYVDLAAICLDYANYDLGLEITRIGIHNVPTSDRLYLQSGVMHAMKGQLKEAEADLITATKLAPSKTLPYVGLGIAWMQMGELQKAVNVLRERAKLNSNDFLVQYLFGEALLRSGPDPASPEEKEALASFEASVKLNPTFPPAAAGLGKVLLQVGQVDRAVEVLRRAVNLDPTDSAPLYQLAQAYKKKGDVARASELLAQVSKMKEQDRNNFAKGALQHIVREGAPGFAESGSVR